MLRPQLKLLKAMAAAMLVACMFAPQTAAAFDANSALKMHNEIKNMQSQVQQISTDDVDALNRIQILEAELIILTARLQKYENELNQNLAEQQLAANQVVQTPLEDPYADSAELRQGDDPSLNLAQNQMNDNGAQELNTVPEALRAQQKPLPAPQAFAAQALPEVDANGDLANGNLIGSLGNQPDDVMAFNEAKGYFDDEYYSLSQRKFNQFIQYYRQSSLISNAYFWLGESYYMRKNYELAAKVFYQGYRTNKKGAKAPDNLFKLASSLLLLGNKSDACSAYYEVDRRYAKSHPQLAGRAQAAQAEHACL